MYMLWFFFVKLLFWRRLDAEAGCQSVVSIRYGVALWWCIIKIVTVYVQHWCVNRRHEKRSRSHDLQCSEWRLLIMLINLYKNTGRNCPIEFTTSGFDVWILWLCCVSLSSFQWSLKVRPVAQWPWIYRPNGIADTHQTVSEKTFLYSVHSAPYSLSVITLLIFCASESVCVCPSSTLLIPTLLHGPGCNLAEW